MFLVSEAAAWKLKLQLCRPAGISDGFNLARVWSGSLRQEVHSSAGGSSLPFCSSCDMPGGRSCRSCGGGRPCGLSLVGTGAKRAAGGWQPQEVGLAAPAAAETQGVQPLSAEKSHLPCQTYCSTHPDSAQQHFSRAAAPGDLPPWVMGYSVVSGAGPELTASVSGRISSTHSLPLPQGNNLWGSFLAPCAQPFSEYKGCSRVRLVALLAGGSSASSTPLEKWEVCCLAEKC